MFQIYYHISEIKIKYNWESKTLWWNRDEDDFPKLLCFYLFFIVDNYDRDFDKYNDEIKRQINEFLQVKDLSFNFQLIFSSRKISNYDFFAIHNSRIEKMNSLSLNSNKINYYYEKNQKEIVSLKNEIMNLKRTLFVSLVVVFYFLFLKK